MIAHDLNPAAHVQARGTVFTNGQPFVFDPLRRPDARGDLVHAVQIVRDVFLAVSQLRHANRQMALVR